MIPTIRNIFIAALLTLAPMAPMAAEATSLRIKPEVTGDKILLADIFDGLPEALNAVEVARAPDVGSRQVFNMHQLARLALQHDLAWQPMGRGDFVIVTRAAQTIPAQDMLEVLTAHLLETQPEQSFEIALDNPNLKMLLPLTADPSLRVDTLSMDPRTSRYSAQIVAPAYGTEQARLTLTGRAYEVVNIPVLSQNAARGDVIGPDDIDWREVRKRRVTRGALMQPDEVIGQQTRRFVRAGMPLLSTQFQMPQAVEKGAVVTITYNTGALRLTARGKALASGAVGDMIRISNLSSRRMIEATVTGADAVSVSPFNTRTAAAR